MQYNHLNTERQFHAIETDTRNTVWTRTMVDCKISFNISRGITRFVSKRLADRRLCAIARKTAAAALVEVLLAMIMLFFNDDNNGMLIRRIQSVSYVASEPRLTVLTCMITTKRTIS